MAKNPARKSTDDRLEELEKKIAREYHTAQQEMWEKATKYFNSFSDRDEEMRAKVAAGKITQEEYTKWRAGAMMSGKRYDTMINDLTWTAVNADKAAMAMTKGSMAETFADNANYAAYEVERATGIDTSFTLYNKDAVSRLIKDNPELLPALNPDSPTARKLAENKDLIWNKQHMTSALTQGILQGDSIGSIAKRLRSVTDMDRRAAVRNARTMTTSAENAGKMHSYERAKEMGIEGKQMWVATHDDRTRDSHAMMDGETVDVGAEFSNKCRFPGDPAGDASEVYNCRCSLVFVSKYSTAAKDYRDSESYEEWHSKHEQAKPQDEEPQEEQEVISEQAQAIIDSLDASGIEYREVSRLDAPLSEDEIISKIGGGDLTTGSCASLAYAYAGNKCGLDVTDYRGGNSMDWFSRRRNSMQITQLAGVDAKYFRSADDFKSAKALLKMTEEGKQYILQTGHHASIVQNIGGKYYYLELQTETRNGWKPFDSYTLKYRFGCQHSHSSYGQKYEVDNILTDVDSLQNASGLRQMLGYMNTAEDAQKKGATGYAK